MSSFKISQEEDVEERKTNFDYKESGKNFNFTLKKMFNNEKLKDNNEKEGKEKE